ncbi:hypothetical protein [Nannocystis punicea]|uniref:Uncharacterized protein n=1 Tax=Nannocystis punicea TaxID=2995304 RepID=A0ABY7H8R2_9BACT|nr:hypothetical protein [Nannocystis poenicansa]WAS95419.1 hypothetical protein O0S08_04600 [Nannocystis poenicansa]
MHSARKIILAVVLVILPGLLACEPDIPEPIWKGERLHHGTTTSEPICRGSFHRQEQHAVQLAELVGVELDEIIRYTRVADRDELAEYCEGMKADGCAHGDEPYAFSIRSFHFHEITHAVMNSAGIEGPRPFAEGFAEVFADGAGYRTEHTLLDQVLHNFKFDARDYQTAGLFARFLLDRHGLDRYLLFLRAADSRATFVEFSAVFEDIFDEPIEQAMADFEAYPSCREMSNRIALVDCSLPLAPWDGRVVTLTADVACDQDDVLGPAQDDVMFTTRGFEVTEAGNYLVIASQPEGWSGFRVVKCGSCLDSFDEEVQPGEITSHDLTPGRYYVLFGRRTDEPATLGLAVGRQ